MKEKAIKELFDTIQTNYPNQIIISSVGNPNSKIMLIGEAPGANEVKLKEPFVGKAGKTLNSFLKMLSLERENCYITNAVKYRPTSQGIRGLKNRTPKKEEVFDFSTFLKEELEIVNPEIIITLGRIPLLSIDYLYRLNITECMNDIHGKEIKIQNAIVFPLYHPAAIIYNKQLIDSYNNDIIKLKKIIEKETFK